MKTFMWRTTNCKGLNDLVGRFRSIPLLSKEGQARSAEVVCSETRSHLIDAREALLINRYCSSLNRPPPFASRRHPA
jgi:hypothetical protein